MSSPPEPPSASLAQAGYLFTVTVTVVVIAMSLTRIGLQHTTRTRRPRR